MSQVRSAILFLVFTTIAGSCSNREFTVPAPIAKKYQKDAHRLCQAIAECMKQDVENRLSADPVRRNLVTERMDRDLCQEGQYRLIGKLSTDPTGRKDFVFRPENYRIYSGCSKAVSAAKNCKERLRLHRIHPDCRALREMVP